MNKKIIASTLVIMSLCTTSVYADYVDNSNREHADQQNDIVGSAFIPKGNTVVIYLDNKTGIDYELGSTLKNFTIPFVEVHSVKAEKKKLDSKHVNEIDSEYYNKITLTTSHSIHDKQRFVMINEFTDGDGSNSEENLLHSISPRGEVKAPKYIVSSTIEDQVESTTTETQVSTDPTSSEVQVTYDQILSCVATDPEHIRLDFADGVELNKAVAEDHLSYYLESESGVRLYVLKAVTLSSNQVILETQKQETNERFSIKADWLNEGERSNGFFYSNSVKN